jgi:hypothetical protein
LDDLCHGGEIPLVLEKFLDVGQTMLPVSELFIGQLDDTRFEDIREVRTRILATFDVFASIF